LTPPSGYASATGAEVRDSMEIESDISFDRVIVNVVEDEKEYWNP
jgi:hypothetical protein